MGAAAAAAAAAGVLASVVSADLSSVTIFDRPDASAWQRTPCGSPSGTAPLPPGPYNTHTDIAGNDMGPCGPEGCVLPQAATHLDCETKCNSTANCVAYVFADYPCSGEAGPLCWLKSGVSTPSTQNCRNYRVIGSPGVPGADIPSRWAAEVSASTTPLPLYPRPQMVRGNTLNRDTGDPSTWTNLNGLWEWQPAASMADPPFGQTLNSSILVPFPVESCLSGVAPTSSSAVVRQMWYRLQFNSKSNSSDDAGRTLLHFGAVDWQSAVFLNGQLLGNHTGGYDGFDFDITASVKSAANELLVYAFDPSDEGAQPNGKQRISAMSSPGGDTYTPSSGIWQTVWLEAVPETFVESLTVDQASLTELKVAGVVGGSGSGTISVKYEVLGSDGKTVIASGSGAAGAEVTIAIPAPQQLWSPDSPHLYDLRVTAGTDQVFSYFGLRTFVLGDGAVGGKRPVLNGNPAFLAGFLDQSFWPDGQYTAPTDEALAYDVQAVPMFGLNMIRLHQKVNPERWYYHADTTGAFRCRQVDGWVA
jgi:hypothetical protein